MADKSGELYRARESFSVPDGLGGWRTVPDGGLLRGDDPLVKSHSHLLESASVGVEQATAAPGQRRTVTTFPEGRSLAEVTAPHTGHAHRTAQSDEGNEEMVHALPPEDPNSPASPFAPAQPAAGVVADDVPKEQNPGGGIPAAKATAKKVGADKVQTVASDPGKGAGPVPAEKEAPTGTAKKSASSNK